PSRKMTPAGIFTRLGMNAPPGTRRVKRSKGLGGSKTRLRRTVARLRMTQVSTGRPFTARPASCEHWGVTPRPTRRMPSVNRLRTRRTGDTPSECALLAFNHDAIVRFPITPHGVYNRLTFCAPPDLPDARTPGSHPAPPLGED